MNKGLKAFNKICKNLNSYEFTDEYKKNKKLIKKELKISDIIKKKKVDIATIDISNNYNEYLDYCYGWGKQLTETEFNLIKEWLKR